MNRRRFIQSSLILAAVLYAAPRIAASAIEQCAHPPVPMPIEDGIVFGGDDYITLLRNRKIEICEDSFWEVPRLDPATDTLPTKKTLTIHDFNENGELTSRPDPERPDDAQLRT